MMEFLKALAIFAIVCLPVAAAVGLALAYIVPAGSKH